MGTLLMTPRRGDPFGSTFDDLFDDPWSEPGWTRLPRLSEAAPVMRARMDVIDQGPAYLISVEMPGVKREDIDVSVEGSHVAISARTPAQIPLKEGEKVLHGERVVAGYARSFELPAEVTDEGAEATFENGVLTLTLPKRAPASRRLTIH
ncbi:MAG: Hsp20/alpha crystallin family protein [Gemmatimonadota bacterium]